MDKYYHGGVPGLRPGDFLLPPSESGYPYPCDLFGSAGRRDRVYVTTSAEDAALFAAFHPWRKGNVYEVEPELPLEPDPDCNEPGLSFATKKAKIVKVVA